MIEVIFEICWNSFLLRRVCGCMEMCGVLYLVSLFKVEFFFDGGWF